MVNVYGGKPTWKSSKSSVAKITKGGTVTALTSGSAKMTANLKGKKYYTTVSVSKMSLSKSKLSLTAGDDATLSVKNCLLKPTWTSSNASVASVDNSGDVEAIQAGQATITATVKGRTFNCSVNVKAESDTPDELPDPTTTGASTSNYTDERTTYTQGVVGQTINVTSQIGNNRKCYTTSDKTIAIVSDSGLVMPLKAGTVTITNTATDDSIDISITEPVTVESGVDISRHNGSVDFAKMKAQGIDFAIIRGGNAKTKLRTTNSNGIDLNFKTNMDKATAAGMKYGVYWYVNTNSSTTKRLMTTTEAKQQATVLADYLDANKTSLFTMPIYLDLEQTSALVKSKTTAAKRAAFIQAICEAYMSVLIPRGYTNIGIYSSTSWYKNNLQNSFFVSNFTSLWQAHYGYSSVTGTKLAGYTSVPSFTYNGVRYYPDLWQTGSDFRIEGVSGYVDMNYRYR